MGEEEEEEKAKNKKHITTHNTSSAVMRRQANAVIRLCRARADEKTKMYSGKDKDRKQTYL